MRLARFGIAIMATLLLSVGAVGQSIMPGADAWVTTSDITPFAVRKASLMEGGAGLYKGYLGDNPANVDAGARYEDSTRGMTVGVRVARQADTTYLVHFLESPFRSHKTGRLLPQATLSVHGGQRLFFYCSQGPDCEDRIYAWLSGLDTVVSVDAKAFVDVGSAAAGPDPRRTPCPEPTEVLDAYLDRYPSTLAEPPSADDESAKQWLRGRVGLMLAAAELRLAAVRTVQENLRGQALHEAREALYRWAQEREDVFRKPAAAREAERLHSLEPLPIDAQLRELEALRDEYRAWWTAHQNDAIELPPG
jgi:hypothetical protein